MESIIDIAQENWDPKVHHEENILQMPPVKNHFTGNSQVDTILNNQPKRDHQGNNHDEEVPDLIGMMATTIEETDPFLCFYDCQEFSEAPETKEEPFFDAQDG